MRTALIFGGFAALLGLIATAKASNGSEAADRSAPQMTSDMASATAGEGTDQDRRMDRALDHSDKLRIQERAPDDGRDDREDQDSR